MCVVLLLQRDELNNSYMYIAAVKMSKNMSTPVKLMGESEESL